MSFMRDSGSILEKPDITIKIGSRGIKHRSEREDPHGRKEIPRHPAREVHDIEFACRCEGCREEHWDRH